jgi:hypothetical protein
MCTMAILPSARQAARPDQTPVETLERRPDDIKLIINVL